MPNTATVGRKPRPVTGRMVLACLVAFFGTIFAMNVVLIRVATSTFGGVETESSYKAGLTFKNDVAASQAQDALHWMVEATLRQESDGTQVTISARDAEARPLSGLEAAARLSHPTDRRRDVLLDLDQAGPGLFRSLAPVPPGQWDFVIELTRGDVPVFRSKSRIRL